MTGSRARPTAVALRSRLSVAFTLGLLGPSLLLAGAIAACLPAHQRAHASAGADRDLRSAEVALRATCAAVEATATATARQVQQYAFAYGTIPRDAAQAAAANAVAARPDAAVAVFDADWRLLALAGARAARVPAAAGGYGASCHLGVPGTGLREAGLAEIRQVSTGDGPAGHVVLWVPLDHAALVSLRDRLGLSGQLAVVGDTDRVLATSTPAGAGGALARAVTAAADQAADQAAPVAGVAGIAGGLAYATRPNGPGLPVRLIATDRVGGTGVPLGLTLAALVIGLMALLPIRTLARRISGPVDDQLELAAGELTAGREALAQTFSRFGEALEHTHDLERLLDTVAAFCLHGTAAVAGLALLADETPGLPERSQTSTSLRARGSAVAADGDPEPAAAALEALPAFAESYFHELTQAATMPPAIVPPTTVPPATAPQPLFARIDGAGHVVAVPVRSGERLVGMLALARGEGAPAFDALALPRVRSVADHLGTAVANVRLHEEVRRLSVTDPLTGVGNVRQLSTTLSREIAGAIRYDRPLTVLMLDLDHFKRVNDTLGHQFGDLVLREFAQRVTACMREIDTVTRYGGEEFAVVLRDTDIDGGRKAAARVLNVVREQPFRHGDLGQSVTASIGVAAFPAHGRSASELLQAADEALYVAKRDGRDRYAVAGHAAGSAISQAAG